MAWARDMGHAEAADLLQETLDEEKLADETLTALAQGGINQQAADASHPPVVVIADVVPGRSRRVVHRR